MDTDTFNFMAIIPGIILGLAIVQVLNGVAGMLEHRESIKIYWIHNIWIVAIWLLLIQHWYTIYSWRHFGCTFISYIYFLIYPTALFIASVILIPDIKTNNSINLKEYYYSNSQLFFGVIALALIEAVNRTIFNERTTLSNSDTWYRFSGIIFMVILMFTRNAKIHGVIALFCLGLLLSFILKYNMQLPTISNIKPCSTASSPN